MIVGLTTAEARRAAMRRKRFSGEKLCSPGTCRSRAPILQIARRRSCAAKPGIDPCHQLTPHADVRRPPLVAQGAG